MEFITKRTSITAIMVDDYEEKRQSITLFFDEHEIKLRFSNDDGDWAKCDVTVDKYTRQTSYISSYNKEQLLDAVIYYDYDIVIDFLSVVFNIRVVLDE